MNLPAASPGRFVCAIQNVELRKELRKMPGIPLVYINPYNQLILEPVSMSSKKAHLKVMYKENLNQLTISV